MKAMAINRARIAQPSAVGTRTFFLVINRSLSNLVVPGKNKDFLRISLNLN